MALHRGLATSQTRCTHDPLKIQNQKINLSLNYEWNKLLTHTVEDSLHLYCQVILYKAQSDQPLSRAGLDPRTVTPMQSQGYFQLEAKGRKTLFLG